MTFPNNTYPSFVKEYAFSKSAFVSGTASDFSAVGVSAVFDGLSGVDNHSYIIWGWQGAFTASGGGSGKGHLVLALQPDSNSCKGILHASDDVNGVVILTQPMKFPEGESVIWSVLDSTLNTDDAVYANLWYTHIRTS